MRHIMVLAVFIGLAGCNTYISETAHVQSQSDKARQVTIAPLESRLSSPVVETDKGVLAYADDLDRCRTRIAARMGSEDRDDLAALRRAVQQGPLGEKVSATYQAADIALSRDKLVKDCMSKQGYRVIR